MEQAPRLKRNKVYFEDGTSGRSGKIQLDRVPYIILGRRAYGCHHGLDRHAKDMKKRQAEQRMGTHDRHCDKLYIGI